MSSIYHPSTLIPEGVFALGAIVGRSKRVSDPVGGIARFQDDAQASYLPRRPLNRAEAL